MRVLALALFLSACSTVTPGPVVCPPLVEYSSSFQAEASKQLAPLKGTPVYELVDDYLILRDMIRACGAK